jgi:hypothetical protein
MMCKWLSNNCCSGFSLTAASRETVNAAVKALVGTVDSQPPQLPLAPVLTLPRLPEQKGVSLQQSESPAFEGAV